MQQLYNRTPPKSTKTNLVHTHDARALINSPTQNDLARQTVLWFSQLIALIAGRRDLGIIVHGLWVTVFAVIGKFAGGVPP